MMPRMREIYNVNTPTQTNLFGQPQTTCPHCLKQITSDAPCKHVQGQTANMFSGQTILVTTRKARKPAKG